MNDKTPKRAAVTDGGYLQRLLETALAGEQVSQDMRNTLQAMLGKLQHTMDDFGLTSCGWDAAINALQDAIFLHDSECRILNANRAYAELAAMPLDELIGRPYWQVFPKTDASLPHCQKLLDEGGDAQMDEVTTGDGRVYFSRGFAVKDTQDNYRYSVHILEDISDQRRLQQQAEESMQRYRGLFESAPDAVLLADAETGKLLDANPAAERLTGRSRAELITLHQSQLHPPHSVARQDFLDHVMVGRTGHMHTPTELTVLNASGREIPVEITTSVFRLGGHQVIQGVFRDISARRESEAKLRRHAQILSQTHDAVVATDLDGIVSAWNKGAERSFGYSEAEAIGRHISFLYPEQDQDYLARQVIAPLKANGRHETEVRMQRKTGERFDAHLSLSLLCDENGTPEGMIGYALDITLRKRAEQALHDSEETFRAISNTAKDAVLLLDDEGKIVYWNPAAERIFGYEAGEVIGQKAQRCLAPPHYHEAWRAAWPHFQKTGKGAVVGKVLELTALRRDGTEFPIELSVSAVRIRGHWNAVGILRDVTERKHAENALKEAGEKLSLSLHLFEGIIESVPIRVFWKDRELRYLGCNSLFAKDAGLARANELIAKTDFDMAWQDQAELYREDDRRVMESGVPKLNYEEPQTTPDGKTIWVRTSKVPLHNDAGEVTGVLGIYDDITRQKQAEEDLQLSEARLKEAQWVAHLGSWELDLVKNELWWSDENHRIFGVEPSARNNYETFLDTVHPDDRDFVNKVYTGSVQNKTPYDIEHRLLMQDGTVKWVHERCKTFYADDGTPLRSAGTTLDITERRQADERLRRSEAGLAEAQRIAHLGNWELDIVSDHMFWSDEIYRIFEIDAQQSSASYAAFLSALHPDDREWVDGVYHESLESKAPYGITHRLRMPDGRIKYVRNICETHYSETGRPLRSLGTMQDISEQYLTEQALNRSNRALKAISNCNSVLIHATSEDDLFNNMCHVIINQGGYRLAWIGLVEDGAGRCIRPVAHAGFEDDYLHQLNITYDDSDRGRGPTGCAVRHGQPQVVHDVLTDPRFAPWREAAVKRGYRSVLALPLKSGNREVFAVLNIYAGEANAFDEEALALMQELADDLAFGILALRTRDERDHYLQEHQKSDERFKQVLVETIRAISLTVEKRDPYTAGHQNKVAQLSVAVGRELGLDEDRLEGLRLGAMIHDIGKIYVPAEILNRPGRLSKAEFEIIKSHAEVGYDIIKDVKFPWPVAQMVLQHHERMDGSGYPNGLQGEDIIFEARILAVADVVEAITAHRPYRPAVGLDKALMEIEVHRGSLYDTAVADACLHLIRDKGYRLDDEVDQA